MLKVNGLLKDTVYRLRSYFEMPQTDSPSLPEVWLAQLRIKSWPVASIAVGISLYIPLFVLAIINTPVEILDGTWLRYSLLYPIVTIYLLLLIPLFKRLYGDAVAAFLPLLPKTQFNDPLTFRQYQADPRLEWLAFGIGVLAGWLIAPYEDYKNMWQVLYGMLGEGITVGLLSWLAYRIAIGTKHLTTLHNQTHGLNIPRPGLFTPLSRWGISILLAFVGGSLLSFLLAPQQNILAPKNLAFYIILNLLILFVFLRRSESASLLAQFRILRAFALFFLVALSGTLGYHYLEGWEPLDGLYMTVITMTTIGYGETRPLQQAGRIFTIILSLISVGIAGYAISAVAAFIFEGDFQRVIIGQKMNKQIAKLHNHIILCGAGHVGEQIAQEFHKTQTPFLLIGQSQETLEPILRLGDTPYLLGDPTKDETLHLAGIERATGLVANLNDDKDNAFVVLSALSLNPHLRIVARLNDEENAEKLRKVGADEIVSPNVIGGLRIASVMLRPTVVSFLDEMMRSTEQTLRLEEKRLEDSSSLVGKTLIEADIGRRTGLLVVAIKSMTGAYLFNPQPQTVLNKGDTIIVIGTPEQLTNLKKLDAN